LCLGLVVLLIAPSSRAETERLRHFNSYREFLGWSKDSRYAVWYEPIFNPDETVPSSRYPPGLDTLGEGCAIHLAWVLDTRRGSMTQYLIDRSIATRQVMYYGERLDEWPMNSPIECLNPDPAGFGGGTEASAALRAQYPKSIAKYRKKYSQVPGPAALRKLLSGSPLHHLSSRTAPDGSLKLEVEIKSKRKVPHGWEDSTLRVQRGGLGDNPAIYDTIIRFMVQRGEQTLASMFVPLSDGRLLGNVFNDFTAIWAPDGRHLALVYTSAFHIKRDTIEDGTAIMPTLGPKIALESTAAEFARAREFIGEALHAAGHSLLSAEAVPKSQIAARTQILWVDGYEAAARAIAVLLPGGADVKKQSAHTSYHLTIKLGHGVSLPVPRPAK